MQGPKGDAGPKGDTGYVGLPTNPSRTCICLISPTIHSGNVTPHLQPERPTVLDCSASGNPDPFITWSKDGVRINNKSNQHLTVTHPGNYTCTAENIVGVATFSFYVT
ncbi:protein sax-3-like [Mizuhopecten yessoensis]|nr:protein sax-3-like [Mizuhopecten yessoensis]